MKVRAAALLLMISGATACAESEPVYADPDEVEAAVKEANEQAAPHNGQTAPQQP